MDDTVVVLGSANADLVVTVPVRPAGGETALGSDVETLPGGKGANTAVAAGRLGAPVAFVGALGTDANGDLLLQSLRSAHVDTTRVRRVDRPTGTAFITVTPDGENSIVVSPGANAALTPEDVDLTGAAVLVASLEIPLPVVEHAVALAAAGGVRPVLNLSPVAELSPRTLAALDPLIVNEHEAHTLTGGTGDLLALGPRTAIITRGARGARVLTPEGATDVPAPAVAAVDTTGAGDAFAGALAASLATGATLDAAARTAVLVAAISVTRPGAQPSYPTADEVAQG
ncbi:ribokinase [Actinokineospora sp. PR83]|uniref:ribokinase n=1 Tax=Actinokineospora sp. PR83 TaxID=2884908 RepID=UPI0027E1377A|nr:PfkB family carbohydrate kinase [Actinokineospora sp. PR83]MCG8917995.1 ribokinase [Actinokineospora sp. PR83]